MATSPAITQGQQTPQSAAESMSLEELLDIAARKQRELAEKAEARRRMLDGNGKRFYSRIPNSTFIVNQGPGICEVLQFHGDQLYTENPQAIDQLLAIADKPGSLIYLQATEGKDKDTAAAFAEVKKEAEIAFDKVTGTKA